MLLNKKFVIFLVLAIIMSLLSANFIVDIVKSYTPVVKYDDPIQVVIAANDITPFSVINSADLTTKEIPQSVVPQGAIGNITDIANKTSRSFLLAGDILRAGHLTEIGTTDNEITAELTTLNDPNARAVMVPVPDGFVISKGDRLNIIYTSRETMSTQTAFTNVLVLSAKENKAYLVLNQKDAEILANMLNTGHVVYTLSPIHVRGAD